MARTGCSLPDNAGENNQPIEPPMAAHRPHVEQIQNKVRQCQKLKN